MIKLVWERYRIGIVFISLQPWLSDWINGIKYQYAAYSTSKRSFY